MNRGGMVELQVPRNDVISRDTRKATEFERFSLLITLFVLLYIEESGSLEAYKWWSVALYS
eukprot:1446749-Amphidinium_carterae.1